MDDEIENLVNAYRAAIESHTKMKYALVAFPDLESQISAPLLARQESKVQAAEIQLKGAIKRHSEGK